jgi:hypothetical protein
VRDRHRRGIDVHRGAAPGDPLDRPGDGQSHRHLGRFGAAHLAGAQTAAAPAAHKRSRDPGFAAKLTDIVGLGACPRAAIGRTRGSIRRRMRWCWRSTKKAQIQALDRTQPGLTIKPGGCQTMTHDDKRHGTTTLFAALSVLDGTVIGRCMQRHRHLEFIRFLNAVERQVAAGKFFHVVLDNYATHKHPKACPRKGGGSGLAVASSALDLPLHPDLGLLPQRRRELFLESNANACCTRWRVSMQIGGTIRVSASP